MGPRARFCGQPCKQSAYRERLEDSEEPTQLWVAPAAQADGDCIRVGNASLRRAGGRWLLELPGAPPALLEGRLTEGQALARARWAVAHRADLEVEPPRGTATGAERTARRQIP